MQVNLTMEQISQVDMALAGLDAISCLCAQAPAGEGLEVNAHNFACLMDILIGVIREGTRGEIVSASRARAAK